MKNTIFFHCLKSNLLLSAMAAALGKEGNSDCEKHLKRTQCQEM